MLWIVSAVVFILLLLFIGSRIEAIRGRGAGHREGGDRIAFPYRRAGPLFSASERSFLGVLDQAVGPEHRVFGKVRVADVALLAPGLDGPARQVALNRIAAKHFDFVVCRASDLAVVCVVELNDRPHASRRAAARDDLLAKVCRTIGLPLLTVTARDGYSPDELRQQFVAMLSPQADPEPRGDGVTLTF